MMTLSLLNARRLKPQTVPEWMGESRHENGSAPELKVTLENRVAANPDCQHVDRLDADMFAQWNCS